MYLSLPELTLLLVKYSSAYFYFLDRQTQINILIGTRCTKNNYKEKPPVTVITAHVQTVIRHLYSNVHINEE